MTCWAGDFYVGLALGLVAGTAIGIFIAALLNAGRDDPFLVPDAWNRAGMPQWQWWESDKSWHHVIIHNGETYVDGERSTSNRSAATGRCGSGGSGRENAVGD